MKILLALAAVWVALCAAETNKVSDIRPERKPKTNLVEVLPTGHHPTNLLQFIRTNDLQKAVPSYLEITNTRSAWVVSHPDLVGGAGPYTFDTGSGMPPTNFFSVSWNINGSNICDITLATNITTQWLTIEQEEGQTHNRVKQIGVLVTNQVLMVTHDGATNEMVLKMLGREEWPSQKRTLMMSNIQNARQSR